MFFRVKNVLGVREAVLDFSKPVVLYGRNGGGKSSAIRSLLLAMSPLQKNGIEEQRWDRLRTLANIGGDIWNYIGTGSAVVAEIPEKDGKKYGIDESGFDYCKGFENTVVDRFPARLLPRKYYIYECASAFWRRYAEVGYAGYGVYGEFARLNIPSGHPTIVKSSYTQEEVPLVIDIDDLDSWRKLLNVIEIRETVIDILGKIAGVDDEHNGYVKLRSSNTYVPITSIGRGIRKAAALLLTMTMPPGIQALAVEDFDSSLSPDTLDMLLNMINMNTTENKTDRSRLKVVALEAHSSLLPIKALKMGWNVYYFENGVGKRIEKPEEILIM